MAPHDTPAFYKSPDPPPPATAEEFYRNPDAPVPAAEPEGEQTAEVGHGSPDAEDDLSAGDAARQQALDTNTE